MTCTVCNKENPTILSPWMDINFCSHECSHEFAKNGEVIECPYCGNIHGQMKVNLPKGKLSEFDFCSQECWLNWNTINSDEKKP